MIATGRRASGSIRAHAAGRRPSQRAPPTAAAAVGVVLAIAAGRLPPGMRLGDRPAARVARRVRRRGPFVVLVRLRTQAQVRVWLLVTAGLAAWTLCRAAMGTHAALT